jgi:hypothetical protein
VLFAITFASLIYTAVALTTNSASAVTADVAKTRSALTAKNVSAPRDRQSRCGQRDRNQPREADFFQRCIANGAMLAMRRASKGGAPRRKPPDLPDKTTAYSRDS